ncbi:uncharacterized protein LOC129952262 [Eupeodes corollae]|uniref:uncharacterized protein LOC129952262 n=1 Tax=Eupeodes corollae TaxID=290404 RepID=UPI002493BE0E|nr:uncharacterized protein LOC129952262 [Eupeodes corollae]
MGQSITERPTARYTNKIIYLLIFLLAIMLDTSYDAFLQTLMTEPPKEKCIKSLEDIVTSKLKIKSSSDHIEMIYKLNPHLKEYHSEAFYVMYLNNSELIDNDENTLNTRYAYVVSDRKWKYYKELQNFIGKKLFRWSEELCLIRSMICSFPIYENSIYKGIFNAHTLDVHSAGLWRYWERRSFYEQLEIGDAKFRDFELKPKCRSIKVEDFKFIWTAIGVAFVISSSCFAAEMFVFKWKGRIKLKRNT